MEEKLFTLTDIKNAFEAGQKQQCEEELGNPNTIDFDEWAMMMFPDLNVIVNNTVILNSENYSNICKDIVNLGNENEHLKYRINCLIDISRKKNFDAIIRRG